MNKSTSSFKNNSLIPPPASHSTSSVGAVIIGGHFQGLGILRNLAQHQVPVVLLDNDFCIGRFSRYSHRFFSCPSVRQEPQFLEFLQTLAVKENLTGWIVYPSDDETVNILAKNKRVLEKYYRIPTPSWEITRFAGEKKLTYQLAEKIGIPVPFTLFPQSLSEIENLKIEYPVILKPSVKEPFYSLTKKKAVQVNNHSELIKEYQRAKYICPQAELMVQELIPRTPDNLFSLGSFFRHTEICGKVIAQRLRQHPADFGHATTCAVTVDIPELEFLGIRFLQSMHYYGLSEIEFMRDPRDRKYKMLEMNARTWGWHTLAIDAGVDLPYLLYRDLLGEKISANGFTKGVKWFHLVTDVPTVLGEISHGRMSLTAYWRSLKGKKRDAVLSVNDPLPFVMEVLMAPYLWIRRGF